MAILNQKRILNLIPKVSAPVTIHVSQGDVGTEIEFTLVKGDEVFSDTGNLTASVHGVREDGANFGPFTCTLSGSKVTFPLHSEMTAVKGSALAEIVLVDNGGNKVGSANFGILVEQSVFPLGVTYDNDVSVYESILAYVQTIPAQLTNDYTSKINAVQSGLNNEINQRTSADALINTRIDEIIAPSGEAPNPAEVVDARIGFENKTYDNLGAATRGQANLIDDGCLRNGQYDLISRGEFVVAPKKLIRGFYTSGGKITNSTKRIRTPYLINVPRASVLYWNPGTVINSMTIGFYNNEGAAIREANYSTPRYLYFNEDQRIVLLFKNTDNRDVDITDFDALCYLTCPNSDKRYNVLGDRLCLHAADFDNFVMNRNQDQTVEYAPSTTRLTTRHLIGVNGGDFITINNTDPSKVYKFKIEWLIHEDLTRDTTSLWYTEGDVVKIDADAAYVQIMVAAQGDSTEITSADYDDNIVIYPHQDKYSLNIELEHGGFGVGEHGEYGTNRTLFHRSRRTKHFVKTNGARFLHVEEFMHNLHSVILIEYNDQFQKIGTRKLKNENETSLSRLWQTLGLDDGCAYIEFELFALDDPTEIALLRDSINVDFYGGYAKPIETYRTAKLNFPTTASDQLLFSVDGDVFSSLRLALPYNYSITGDKVPLIIWMRGSSTSSEWTEDFDKGREAYKEYMNYLMDEGFAICKILGWGSYFIDKYGINVENASPYPTPTCRAIFLKAIEYVCDRYNVDPLNIHLLSMSQGGQLSTFYVTNPDHPFRSICMFSPVNDYLSMPGQSPYNLTRKAIAEDLNLQGDIAYFIGDNYHTYTEESITILQNNIDKINQLNEAWAGLVGGTLQSRFNDSITDGEKFWEGGTAHTDRTDIYNHHEYAKIGKVPTKIWGAVNDSSTPYRKMTEVIDQLRNGGCHAEMRTYLTGNHGAPILSEPIDSVTTKRGTTYTNLPAGWYEAVDFMRECMTKQ